MKEEAEGKREKSVLLTGKSLKPSDFQMMVIHQIIITFFNSLLLCFIGTLGKQVNFYFNGKTES